MSETHPEGPGKPPRSVKSIRAALEAIHFSSDAGHAAGPLLDGLKADDRIMIATFYNPDNAHQYQYKLRAAGITSSRALRNRRTEISVDYEDRERAARIYDEHQRDSPDRRPMGIRREFDYLIFGIGIGLSIGFIFLVDSRDMRQLAAPLIFSLTGAMIGHLIDRVRMNWRKYRRFRFGVREFLIVATLPGLIALICKFVPQAMQ